MTIFLILAACFLAYSNGANDNFKGVASLFGSRTTGYKIALGWATLTTFAGSICSLILAEALLKKFSGKGLVPDVLIGQNSFLLAVALGAGLTVILATVLGFPVSTTHGLTGAIVGAGLSAVGAKVKFAVLGKQFLLPLLLSPVLAVVVGASIYLAFRFARIRAGITKDHCVCIGRELKVTALPQPNSVMSFGVAAQPTIIVDNEAVCSERYAGTFLGVNCQKLMDASHFVSAGVVSFARGLNDTPKMAALLLSVKVIGGQAGMWLIAVIIAIGGLLSARRVAETMSKKITKMNHGQGFSSNLATGLLVILATRFGLPVSTTHVAVGSLFGIGLVTRQADIRVAGGILLSWLLTLPCAALIAAFAYALVSRL